MEEHIQHAAPLLPVHLIGNKHGPQHYPHLEYTSDGPGNHLAEQQAVGRSTGHQHLDSPVALLVGNGDGNHLPVIHNQHKHDDHQRITIPVVASRILVQHILRHRNGYVVHSRNLFQIPPRRTAVTHPIEKLHRLLKARGIPVRQGFVKNIVLIFRGSGHHKPGLGLLGLHRLSDCVLIRRFLPGRVGKHLRQNFRLHHARQVQIHVNRLFFLSLCLLFPASSAYNHYACKAGHIHNAGQKKQQYTQYRQNGGQYHKQLVRKILLQFIP